MRDRTGAFPALERVLRNDLPVIAGRLPGAIVQTTDLAELRARALGLESSTLVIQGPPGTGKTYTGARLITELVRAGKRVGITAFSHKAIDNLCREIEKAAAKEGLTFTGTRHGGPGNHDGDQITRGSGGVYPDERGRRRHVVAVREGCGALRLPGDRRGRAVRARRRARLRHREPTT